MIGLSRSGMMPKMIFSRSWLIRLTRNNPISMMSDSGARGNISNFTQLAGMWSGWLRQTVG